jgi:hypothetical protein
MSQLQPKRTISGGTYSSWAQVKGTVGIEGVRCIGATPEFNYKTNNEDIRKAGHFLSKVKCQ